jgi:hypothetical protein
MPMIDHRCEKGRAPFELIFLGFSIPIPVPLATEFLLLGSGFSALDLPRSPDYCPGLGDNF